MLMNSSDEGHDHSPSPHPWQTQTIHLFEHEREPMFQKPLTPSDVGKLNRLVIPKQHAEKYFPLDTTTTSSSTSVSSSTSSPSSSSGLLLSFEDETGKCWRFRYSYWNSSQSYVLTKGWSRYVKEKRLDAGDVVLFERCRGDEGRLFIGWRRRGATSGGGSGGGGGFGWCYGAAAAAATGCYPTHLPLGLALPYSQLPVNQGQRTPPSSTSTPTGNSKTLRLFGVNLECQLDEPSSDPQSSDGSPMSSSQGPSPTYRYFDYVNNHPHANHHNHMDINFQMGNRLG
ncbi:hypothetical protein Droror1_Dr00008953 [Drosera rotundifolia]